MLWEKKGRLIKKKTIAPLLFYYYLQDIVELVSGVGVLGVVRDTRVRSDEGILGADVQRVVDFPVDVPDLARGVKQTLKKEKKISNLAGANVYYELKKRQKIQNKRA